MARDGVSAAGTIRYMMLIARREYDAADVTIDSIRRATGREAPRAASQVAALQGKLENARRHLASDPVLLNERQAAWARQWLGNREQASRYLNQWFAVSGWDTVSADRREYRLAIRMLADLGRVEEAKEAYAEWEKVSGQDLAFAGYQHEAIGHIAGAEGLLDSAASSFLRWHATPFVGIEYIANRGLVEAADALDRLGYPDSAVVLYERALAQPSMRALTYEDWYPFVLRRLGELHESLGHREEAIEYYSKFVDLWKDADPELQPQVEEARAAVARLASELG
jgi:tetratricopeptide (TPR) repeat protein